MFVKVWITLGCICAAGAKLYRNGIEEIYHWREVIYEDLPFDDDYYIGKYPYHIPANNDVNGLSYHAKSGLMLTAVGRLRPGVPSTLNAFCVGDYDKGSSPHLWGFPNYEMNTLKASFYEDTSDSARKLNREQTKYSAGYFKYFFRGQNELDLGRKRISAKRPSKAQEDFTIISIYRPIVDNRCDRLFIMDIGVLYFGPHLTYHVQNPAIVVFDLPSDGCERRNFPVARRVEIPDHLWKNAYGFAYITLDYQSQDCDDLFLYIPNTFDHSIVVYDYKRGTFWAYTHPSMGPVYTESLQNFYGMDFNLSIGLIDVVLGWPDQYGNRNAYYAPGTSLAEYVVSTELLKNPKRSSFNYDHDGFTLIGYRGCDTQNFRQVIDLSTGVIFFGQTQSKKLLCWNIQNPFNPDTIGVLFESDALQFVSEVNIDAEGYLWFHSSHLAFIFLTDDQHLDISDVNSRTFRVKASEVIKGSVCDTSERFRDDF